MHLTAVQAAALTIIYEKAARGPRAKIGYGEGTEIHASTARALAARGLVTLHVDEYSRPSRAGFGRARNATTVYENGRWLALVRQ